nr:branchpoint-bridging protein isoform X2 [Bactrocera oleae]XP_036231455.1 branchpoint-bridging protein isoform X2 [Bactrocera oleae]
MELISKSNMNALEDRSSKSMEKLKMLDITRDRPVKVAVKVAVPVRDHPKFNFVGKLLGPKGNSMKRLQEETMCKMAVLGRGSMRDRKKEEELRASGDSRYGHLFEDLHVEISTFAAPAEAHARIAYALAEVRRFLVPDYHDDIRQEQMWEMQALSSSSSLTYTDDQHSPNRGGVTDMDTSNDEKLELEPNGMECNTLDKNETQQVSLSSEQQQQQQLHQHQQQQQQRNLHHLLHQPPPPSTRGPNTPVATVATHHHTNLLPTNTDGLCQKASAGSTATAIHPTAMSVALQHQLTAASIGNILKPAAPTAAGVPTVTDLHTVTQQPNTAGGIPLPTEAEAPMATTLGLLDPPTGALLHPALRSVKAINIAGGLARKRPLLGVPRSSMNPTKRTVMTLLARAKNSQALHAVRNPITAATAARFADPLQMLTSPFILSSQPMDQSMLTFPKESLAQGV